MRRQWRLRCLDVPLGDRSWGVGDSGAYSAVPFFIRHIFQGGQCCCQQGCLTQLSSPTVLGGVPSKACSSCSQEHY